MPNDSGRTAVAAAPAPIKLAPVIDNGEFAVLLDSDRFAQIQRVAKLFSESDFVPEAFHGKPANCAVALQMAFRMQIDPMMLMQNMYIVYGRPGIEAKLAIALINSRGPFTGPLQWKSSGEGDNRQWTCYATHKVTGEKCEQTITWAMVKAEGWLDKKGSKWATMPDIMGKYRSAMFLGRLYCPETLLGLSTSDELIDIAGGERVVSGRRIEDEIPLPTERAEPTEPAATAGPHAPIDVDVTTDEIKTPAQQAEPSPADKVDGQTMQQKAGAMTPASKAQRDMVVTVAGKAGINADALDGALVDKFAFVLDDMPAEMFSAVLGHFKQQEKKK